MPSAVYRHGHQCSVSWQRSKRSQIVPVPPLNPPKDYGGGGGRRPTRRDHYNIISQTVSHKWSVTLDPPRYERSPVRPESYSPLLARANTLGALTSAERATSIKKNPFHRYPQRAYNAPDDAADRPDFSPILLLSGNGTGHCRRLSRAQRRDRGVSRRTLNGRRRWWDIIQTRRSS